jgi:hypothetical protein
MKVLLLGFGLISLLGACSSAVPVHPARSLPHTVTLLPDLTNETWDFVETDAKGAVTRRLRFAFTAAEAETCISGNWHRAKLLSATDRQVSSPAYTYESGRLELLLSSELCDSYSSYIGQIDSDSFAGAYVTYGMFGSTEHGKVTGTRRK